jgi:hypothetical protein
MKRPPMKKTATRSVARIWVKRSCERERMSRNVQITRLNQKMTTKATVQPMSGPRAFCNEVIRFDVEDAVGATVGVAAGPAASTRGINITYNGFTGRLPLSEKRIIYCTQSRNALRSLFSDYITSYNVS